MRVGIDLYPLCRPISGVGFYIKYLTKELLRQGEVELVYPAMASWRSWSTTRQHRIAAQIGPGKLHWDTRCFPGAEVAGRLLPMRWGRFGIDLYHVTSTLCWFSTWGMPTVLTAHDLAWLRLPSSIYQKPVQFELSRRYPRLLRAARHVVCVSEVTRNDVAELARVPEDRLSVTPLAARHEFVPPPDDTLRQQARAKLSAGRPYFLVVGTLEPRKNHLRIIQAFAQLVRAGLPHRLILVGGHGPATGAIREAINLTGLEHRVDLAGYRTDAEVLEYLWGADALLLCSLYEGFGLPVLEAMATGLPVIASNAGALPEVAGTAAILVDPLNNEAIADGMRKVADSESLRSQMKTAGLQQAKRFSWTDTARRTVEAYRRACA